MRVAWVTHRKFDDLGGAERSDRLMLERRPPEVTVTVVQPGGVAEDLAEYDRVVVTGLYGFSSQELQILARLKPIVWAHDMQFTGHWLYEEASIFIALNATHLEWEREKNRFVHPQLELNPGWIDTADLRPSGVDRSPEVLWAHRPEAHKGLDRAAAWAAENGMGLRVMVGRPHWEVIQAMKFTTHFILLSTIRDPGPFAVIEASLCGCELVLDNVGIWEDRDELREVLNNADKHFWGLVCGSL